MKTIVHIDRIVFDADSLDPRAAGSQGAAIQAELLRLLAASRGAGRLPRVEIGRIEGPDLGPESVLSRDALSRAVAEAIVRALEKVV
jgi:hypothetical protein